MPVVQASGKVSLPAITFPPAARPTTNKSHAAWLAIVDDLTTRLCAAKVKGVLDHDAPNYDTFREAREIIAAINVERLALDLEPLDMKDLTRGA